MIKIILFILIKYFFTIEEKFLKAKKLSKTYRNKVSIDNWDLNSTYVEKSDNFSF